jgi:hypothetical protein
MFPVRKFVIREDLQCACRRDEQLAINTNAHLTESQIVWASFTGAHRDGQHHKQ